MRVTLTSGNEYRLYFRHYHTQSVLIKRDRKGKIDHNSAEIRTIKELVATECILQYIDSEDDPFGPIVKARGISIKSPGDVANKSKARIAAIKHMVSQLSTTVSILVWDAYFSRPGAEPRPEITITPTATMYLPEQAIGRAKREAKDN